MIKEREAPFVNVKQAARDFFNVVHHYEINESLLAEWARVRAALRSDPDVALPTVRVSP
jgi:hypothetical protein